MQNIARLLGKTFGDKKDLRLSVMSAIRRLVTKAIQNDKQDDAKELSKFAKNYLPLFLNVYTTKPNGTDEEGHRLAALDTIKVPYE